MTSGLSENTALPVNGQHRHKQPVPSTRSIQYSQTFFYFGGCHYLVAGDRLFGWVEIFKAPHGTVQTGAQGLIAALRPLFATFGVPEEISSDGSPEFSSAATDDFLTRWEVRHRIFSAYFPQSNCRAEVAVKKAKRMLMDNVGPTGSMKNDGLLRELLQALNTLDPDGNISPAHVVFDRPIRDAFSFFINHPMHQVQQPIDPSHMARGMVPKSEDAMRAMMPCSTEALDMHMRPLAPLSLGDKVFLQNERGSQTSGIFLLPLAQTPDRRDQRLLVSLPKDKVRVGSIHSLDERQHISFYIDLVRLRLCEGF